MGGDTTKGSGGRMVSKTDRSARRRVAVTDLAKLPAMLTVEEASDALGVGRSNGFEMVRLGVMPAVHLSPRRIGVPAAALIRRFNLDGKDDREAQ